MILLKEVASLIVTFYHDALWPYLCCLVIYKAKNHKLASTTFEGDFKLNSEISLFCDTFYFNKLQVRICTTKSKSLHFLKSLFKANSKINFSRLWPLGYLKYLAP